MGNHPYTFRVAEDGKWLYKIGDGMVVMRSPMLKGWIFGELTK